MIYHSEKQNGFMLGCLLVVAFAIFLIAMTSVGFYYWNNYRYEQENMVRDDSMDNLANFNDELKDYLSEHEGNYPDEQGVNGMAEMNAKSSDLSVKDDENVSPAPDDQSEQNTSYAYVASGLSVKEMESGMPVLFEKPLNRDHIHVLLSDGRMEVIENKGFKNVRQVIEYYKERSNGTSAAWDTLLRNADSLE